MFHKLIVHNPGTLKIVGSLDKGKMVILNINENNA